MNLRSFSWIAIAGLACGGAALSYSHLSDRLAGEVTKLKQELSQVKRGRERGPASAPLVQLVSAAGTASAEGAPPPAPASATPEASELTEEQRAELELERKRHAEARVELFQTEHANEPADAEWSRAAQARVDATYSAPEFQALRIHTSCKYTLCRTDVSYADAEAGPEALRRFASTRPWSARRSTKIDLETGEGTSFIAREGFDLPSLDPKSVEN